MNKFRVHEITNVQSVSTVGDVWLQRFAPMTALRLGVLGGRPAQATRSGVESVLCCHSAIAWA